MTDYESSVEELKNTLDVKQSVINQKNDEINRLNNELQDLRNNPPRQTSQLEEAIILIPAIQDLLTGDRIEKQILDWFDKHGKQLITDIVEDTMDDSESEIKNVVRSMSFELSDASIEVW